MPIDRRRFLQSLAALGAAVLQPALSMSPTASQIDEAWQDLARTPWEFEVDKGGTLVTRGVEAVVYRHEVYDVPGFHTCRQAAKAVAEVPALQWHLVKLVEQDLQRLEEELDEAVEQGGSTADVRRLRKQVKIVSDLLESHSEDQVARYWIEKQADDRVEEIREAIDDWLGEEINYLQGEHESLLCGCGGGQDHALSFFRDRWPDLADELGVVVVEGEHPGSTYYAAELRTSVKEANKRAADLGVPIRFVSEETT